MNTNAQYSIIRQKANYERIFDIGQEEVLYSPAEDNGHLYLCTNTGRILYFNEGGIHEEMHKVQGGSLSSIVFEENDNSEKGSNCFFTDRMNCGVYQLLAAEKKVVPLVTEYEGKPLIGPNSITFDKEANCLYFTDGGDANIEMLEKENPEISSLNYPKGSLFKIDLETKLLKPVLYKCLAYPSFVLKDPESPNIFVADMLLNQVIKLTQHPTGVLSPCLFHQFNGRLGPSALAKDGNYLFVARYDFELDISEFQKGDDEVENGVISVLNKEGNLVGELILPSMSEITGMMIYTKKKDLLYITEKTNNGVIKIKLSSFNIDLEKIDRENSLFK